MSLIARHLENLGLPTLCQASALDIIEAGNPPRAVFVDYPLGHSSGKPFDSRDQHDVTRDSLAQFEAIEHPGTLVHLPKRWSDDDNWKNEAMNPQGGDTRQPRDTTPQYQTEDDRLLAEGSKSLGLKFTPGTRQTLF